MIDSSEIRDRFSRRDALVGVVGIGYVGLPLLLGFGGRGFKVLGFDILPDRCAQLLRGETYLEHIPSERIRALLDSGRLDATSDFSRVSEVDALLICVPTPLNTNRDPDLSYVISTTKTIAPYLKEGALVILESTTYPGTTAEEMVPILESHGRKAGGDLFVAYSPEREDPGKGGHSAEDIPKVVGADDPVSLELARELYSHLVVEVVPVSGTRVAEAVKLTENIFRAVNIALVNELKIVFTEMGIDVWEVIEAAKTKPFGYMPFYPGPGLGGHCIPIDPFYLTWKAREFEVNTRFIELAGEINSSMPRYVMARLFSALNEHGKALKGSRVLVVGLAYKPDVDDMRESPALRIIDLLLETGAEVDYYDPHIPAIKPNREYPHLAGKKSVPWNPERLEDFDAAVIVTAHSGVDYQELARRAGLVVDTRNATRGVQADPGKLFMA